jgi:DNA-binding NtrC family response regulator
MDKLGRILCLDDDAAVLARLGRALRYEGYSEVFLFERPGELWEALEGEPALAVILDLAMPEADGYEILAELRARYPELPVIVATALDDTESAVRCMRAGAFDFVPKTAETARLIASLEHAAQINSLRRYGAALRDSMLAPEREPPACFKPIVTRDQRMLALFRYIEAIASSDKAILVGGESGTGKELFAAAIHGASGRKGRLVTVNIAGLDDTMFSDTLFGHKKGAFTGADADRPGLIEQAAGGTLFLDEIGDLSQQSQVKLLRLIEQRLYYPLGADLTRSSDALIVAATNRDLGQAAAQGSFRRDLYYRLSTHYVAIPPLRERYGDLPLLVAYFASKAAEKFKKEPPTIPVELYDLLRTFDFPGNVRELESLVYDAVGRSASRVLPLASFKERILPAASRDKAANPASGRERYGENGLGELLAAMPVLPGLKAMNEALILEAMRRSGGNQGIAAGLLGLSRTALNRRLSSLEKDGD